MKVVGQKEILQTLQLGQEFRDFELKGSGSVSDGKFLSKVARAVQAMSNLRGGGIIVVGVDEVSAFPPQPGLSDEQYDEWSDSDLVLGKISKYCDPAPEISLTPVEAPGGIKLVALGVSQFDQVPIICKKSYEGALKQGVIYCRPRGKVSSEAVPNFAEMRELIDLATESEFRRVRRVVGSVSDGRVTEQVSTAGGEGASIDEQLDKLRERLAKQKGGTSKPGPVCSDSGYLSVFIRPLPHEEGRQTLAEAKEWITDNAIRLRGWPLPYVSSANSHEMFSKSYGETFRGSEWLYPGHSGWVSAA